MSKRCTTRRDADPEDDSERLLGRSRANTLKDSDFTSALDAFGVAAAGA